MLRWLAPYAAHALTALRVVSTPVFVAIVHGASSSGVLQALAPVVFAAVAASDVYDGRVARRFGKASRAGRIFDHAADITFILAALGTYAALGMAPWWVPAAIAGSFAFYVFDSLARTPPAAPALIGSRIGHLGGIANYVVIGVLVFNDTVGLHWLPNAVLTAMFWAVPTYSMAAVVSRLSARRAGAPLVGTPARPEP